MKKIKLSLLAAAIVLLPACTRKIYVPVENSSHEKTEKSVGNIRADSVVSREIIYIRGDTLVEIIERERIRNVMRTDTILVERVDTLSKIVEIHRPPGKIERAVSGIGWIAIGAVLAGVLFLVLRSKFRRYG